MLLSAVLWGPWLAALILALLPVPEARIADAPASSLKPSETRSLLKGAAVALASGLLLLQAVLWRTVVPSVGEFQLAEFQPWLPPLGLNYSLAVDGLALPLLGLNALLTWIVVLSSDRTQVRPKLFYVLVFLIHGGIAGALLSQNLLLFLLFYELELIPVYLAIAVFGGPNRDRASMKFLVYTAISGLILLGAMVALGWVAGGPQFEFGALQAVRLPRNVQLALAIALLIGFGIKTPLVPLHAWLPDTYVEASAPIAVLLGGILAKLGSYGLFRFVLQLFPAVWQELSPYLAGWGAACVLYGAVTAIAQKDIKRMVAYSSIGHMGYILLAGAAATPLAVTGGIVQMASHGLILAVLFDLVGIIEKKVGTRELDVLNGLFNPIRGLPAIAAFLVVAGMASAGIPGLVGFIAEFLIFQGSIAVFPIPTLLCILGTGLTAVYFVILLNRTCFGKLDNFTSYYPKVTANERVPAFLLTALVVFFGLVPGSLTRWSEATAVQLVRPAPTATVSALVPMRLEVKP